MKSTHLILLAVAVFADLQPGAKAQSTVSTDLGSASNFAVLAGSAITFGGAATIYGDIGSYPTAAITGPGPLTLYGTNQGNNSVAEAAQSDLSTAFAAAAGETSTTISGNLGGLTPLPGVYNFSSSISGTVTLNGNSADVWIFQVEALTTAADSDIVLTGGAQAGNVFWQVGSSATLGNDSEFAGTILAQTSITADTGAMVDGGLLAEDGAVTLDGGNIITAIPEPGETSLLIAGFAALLVFGQRIRRHYSHRSRSAAGCTL